MITTERLHMYPFLGFLKPEELTALAQIAEVTAYPKGEIIFYADQPAHYLYLLEKGCVELYHESFDPIFTPELRRQFLVGEISPGEVFGISALVEPHRMTATAIAPYACQVIRIDAQKLGILMGQFPGLPCLFYQQALHTLMERLHDTRIQLAAARTG